MTVFCALRASPRLICKHLLFLCIEMSPRPPTPPVCDVLIALLYLTSPLALDLVSSPAVVSLSQQLHDAPLWVSECSFAPSRCRAQACNSIYTALPVWWSTRKILHLPPWSQYVTQCCAVAFSHRTYSTVEMGGCSAADSHDTGRMH